MKRLLAVLAVTGALLAAPVALAHDPAVDDLTARVDALASASGSQSASVDDLYALVDALAARLDSLESSQGGQSAAIDDLYAIVDEITGAAPEPAEKPE